MKKKDKAKFSKIVVVSLLVTVLLFTIAMILIFCLTEYHTVPDTLISSFFIFAGGEAGCLGVIKFGDTKYDKTKKRKEQPDYVNEYYAGESQY